MRHKLLGRSGLRVSELCLGTLTFGEAKTWGSDEAESAAILKGFADAGGTFIDTAPNYGGGAAEEIVGRFLAGQRDDFVVATKFTASTRRHPLAGGNSRKAMTASVEASLRRLGVEAIDLFWLHYWDGTTPLDEILRGLDDLVRAGKVLYIGISDTPAWILGRAALFAELRGWSAVIAAQIEYNVAARSVERDLVPMAEALEMGLVCWGSLAAGALAGGKAPRRRPVTSLSPDLLSFTKRLRLISSETGLASATLALRWLLQRTARTSLVPIIGAREASQLDATLAAAGASLDEEIISLLDALAPPQLGFPHELIGSPYLRRLALGDPAMLAPPVRARS